MRKVVRTTAFKRDFKKLLRQGKEVTALTAILLLLEEDAPMPPHLHDHALKGNWKGHRELHIQNDWLLIYKTTPDKIYLGRTGSHSEVLK